MLVHTIHLVGRHVAQAPAFIGLDELHREHVEYQRGPHESERCKEIDDKSHSANATNKNKKGAQ
jgi:hypothetical protein